MLVKFREKKEKAKVIGPLEAAAQKGDPRLERIVCTERYRQITQTDVTDVTVRFAIEPRPLQGHCTTKYLKNCLHVNEKKKKQKDIQRTIVAKALDGQRYPLPLCLCM